MRARVRVNEGNRRYQPTISIAPIEVVREEEEEAPRDREIRRSLLERLSRETAGRIIQELGLLLGEIRADIAVISSGLHGFEIKSRYDSLERLPKQQALYNRVFDRVTLVSSPHHLERAQRLVPSWWGIWIVRSQRGELEIDEVRGADENPQVDVEALVQLLWKDEVIEVLRTRRGFSGLRNRRKRELWAQLVHCVPQIELKQIVREALVRRANWRSS